MASFESIVIGADWISEYYLTSDGKNSFNASVRGRERQWKVEDEAGRPSPKTKFSAVRSELLRNLAKAAESARPNSSAYRDYLDQVENILGFTPGRGIMIDRSGSLLRVSRMGTPPNLAIVEMTRAESVEDVLSRHGTNLVEPTFLREEGEVDEEGREFTNAARLTSAVFLTDPKPDFVLLLAGKWVVVAQRERWAEGRFLAIDLQLVAESNDARAGKEISTALTCLESASLLPDVEGDAWWSRELTKSIKHTVGVSKDLREGVRESIELLASEVVERRRTKGLAPLPQKDAQVLARQSLRFLYRILFLLYAEASPELEILPVNTPEYEQGYSLDRLRELLQVPLTDPEDQEGTHLYDSLNTLFTLVNTGYTPRDPQGIRFNALRADLFEPKATALIDEVGLGNHALQDALARLLLSKEQRGKDRGFISYAELGINQLGAVYEGLMSYTGFFAEDYLYEVAKGGNTEKGSWVVSADRIEGISPGDFVRKEDPVTGEPKPVVYEPGSFVFRLAGRERQQSASYYTPEVLTRFAVSQGLEELITPETTADQILSFKVCEPALGSGAFAIEATRQLAERYVKRRQEELGQSIDPQDYPKELQKTKAYIALHNVYGVDLNDTAVELAEISLWLDTMVAGLDAPWFGLHLRAGNSLIGARHAIYSPAALKRKAWLKTTPTEVSLEHLGEDLEHNRVASDINGGVHHFLLPADGWGSATASKEGKELEPENTKALREWARSVKVQPNRKQTEQLQGLARRVERLWQFSLQRLRIAEQQSSRTVDVWEQPEGTRAEGTRAEDAESARPVQREEIEAALADPNGAYRRLRTVMDAWAALWFWPLSDEQLRVTTEQGTLTVKPPSFQEWLDTLTDLLGSGGNRQSWDTETFLAQADWEELGEAEQMDLSLSLATTAEDARIKHPWLQVTDRIAHQQRFFHWELDFASVFARGGFDFQVGNPPWVRPTVDVGQLLAEGNPWWQLANKPSQAEVKAKRVETLAQPGMLDLVVGESSAMVAQGAFLRSSTNYPHLGGLQPDTYRCFMEQTWRHMSPGGIVSMIHPETHFTDDKAGVLRKATYVRLRRHWQFINEKQLFEEVHHLVSYGVHVYGSSHAEPSFLQAVSLYHPETVEASLLHNGEGEEPGIKDREGNWDTSAHRDRIIRVDAEVLGLWAEVVAADDNPLSTPMVYTVNASLSRTLSDLTGANRVGQLGARFSSGWHETGGRRDGMFDVGWGVPESWDDVILQGPHMHVGNPSYKYPNETMKHNQDWHSVDLETLASDAIPVTSYKPVASKDVYDAAYTNWGEGGRSDPARDHYRVAWRRMAANTGERTLIPAVIPPGAAHINAVLSVGFPHLRDLLGVAGVTSSLLIDLVARSSPKGDIQVSTFARLPIGTDHPLLPYLRLRVLRLNALTRAYTDLWDETWEAGFAEDRWAGGRPRPNRPELAPRMEMWTADSPLRIAEDRRQALVEIDALVAVMLEVSADQLATVYRTAFPVLYGYDTKRDYYDQNGRLVPGAIVKAWLKGGDKLDVADRTAANASENTYTYAPPFVLLDREADLRQAHGYFTDLVKAAND